MLHSNPYFSKESFKKVTSGMSWQMRTLIYDGSYDGTNRDQQIKAGKELRQVYWILATIIDHIFDYDPYAWYLADDEEDDYLEFRQWFIQRPEVAVRNAITYASNNFAVLETVTRDELNQHSVPKRDPENEQLLLETLHEIQDNLELIAELLRKPKKVSDPDKPTREEIKGLVKALQKISDNYSKQTHLPGEQIWRITNMIEGFLNPLYLAWRVYHYGWHTDFLEEGDSMFPYMTFAYRADEHTYKLIELLESRSPFSGPVTQGLLKVYRHLMTQEWRNHI